MPDRLEQTLANPTLHPNALTEAERLGEFKWHKYASSSRSSQVLCVSAFGTLRHLKVRDKIIDHFLSAAMPAYRRGRRAPRWSIGLEREEPELLNECGGRRKQPTSIDVLLVSSKGVFAVEAKFVVDARAGFGGCSQFRNGSCAGFYGPGSDARAQSQAWCRLETWEGERSPRTYWALGREFFRPKVFAMQGSGSVCPMRGSNYQLMRNFLFGATYARKYGLAVHGMITIAPAATSALLREQVDKFQTEVLLPDYANLVRHTTYEDYVDVLRSFGDDTSAELAEFLETRIGAIVGE